METAGVKRYLQSNPRRKRVPSKDN